MFWSSDKKGLCTYAKCISSSYNTFFSTRSLIVKSFVGLIIPYHAYYGGYLHSSIQFRFNWMKKKRKQQLWQNTKIRHITRKKSEHSLSSKLVGRFSLLLCVYELYGQSQLLSNVQVELSEEAMSSSNNNNKNQHRWVSGSPPFKQ